MTSASEAKEQERQFLPIQSEALDVRSPKQLSNNESTATQSFSVDADDNDSSGSDTMTSTCYSTSRTAADADVILECAEPSLLSSSCSRPVTPPPTQENTTTSYNDMTKGAVDPSADAGATTLTQSISSSSSSNPEILDQLTAERKAELVLETTMNKSGKKILKRDGTEIPIRNKGWKGLPKADLSHVNSNANNTPTTTSTQRTLSIYPRQVRFHCVLIRTYDQCVGDNPAVSFGTPIQLDWTYQQYTPITLDAYEESRLGNRKQPQHMSLNYYQRRNILLYRFGCSEGELQAAEQAANKIKAQRNITKALLPAAALEHLVSAAARKTKRMLRKTKPQQQRPSPGSTSLTVAASSSQEGGSPRGGANRKKSRAA